ncbi:hypothetical protein [Rhizobium herbae]|uniref:hypothetical protein n=1 Tax=Rhizobium herbae TaxID=508661 RepID=UPI001CB79FCA|nr:hypothetical protein [Rhizobium herbae]
MKAVFKKIRPRKVMFVIAGVLVLSGASGAFAVYSGTDALLGVARERAPSLSGLACTTVETLKVRRNGQRWIRKYVSIESAGGVDRVRTALRITGLLARQEKADLYQVVVLDQAGPQDRAERRGPAIGAEVLFAPDPTRMPGMSTPFVARYNEGTANTAGLFYGREVALTTDDIKSTMTAMDDKSDCFDPIGAAAAATAGAVGSASGAHGEEAAADQAEAAVEHGAEAAAPEQGEEPLPEHGEAKQEKGLLGSMMAMVWGQSAEPAGEAPADRGAEKAGGEGAGH